MIRHILYLSEEEVSLFEWKKNELVAHVPFCQEDDSLDEFREILENLSDHPVQILINLQEEDYQREVIPFSGKKEQAFMSKRLLEKYYRDAEYTYFEVQGRNSEGRRDSRVFLSSITISEELKKYINLLVEMNFSVCGIWSVPILSNHMVGADCDDNYILLVKEKNHYRESVFVRGEMIVSRKINHNEGFSDYQNAEFIISSVDHLYKFSTNKRLINFQEDMKVQCLIDKDIFDNIENIKTNKNISYHYIDKGGIIDKTDIFFDKEVNESIIYSYLCASQKIHRPHYKKKEEMEPFIKKKVNDRFFNLVGLLSFSLFFLSSVIYINNQSLHEVEDKIKNEKEDFQFNYNERFGDIQIKLDNIQSVSSMLNESLSRQFEADSMPTDLFFELSSILDNKKFNKISIDNIRWKRYTGIEYDAVSAFFPDQDVQSEMAEDDLGLDVMEEEERSGVYAHISGLFDHQYLDYAGSVDKMIYFNNALKSISYVDDVYMISSPIDVRTHSQFIDFSGSLLNLNVSKNNYFEFILSVKEKIRVVE